VEGKERRNAFADAYDQSLRWAAAPNIVFPMSTADMLRRSLCRPLAGFLVNHLFSENSSK
jgi:hypothetical protein